MIISRILLVLSLAASQTKAQTSLEIRTKVLNALRANSEISEVKVTQTGSDKIEKYKFSVQDLNPDTFKLYSLDGSKAFDLAELTKFGLNPEILSYSFFNSEIPKPFGLNKKYHITYTPVVSPSGTLSHFLVYYDKANFYPVKVAYFNGNKKVTTIEYSAYRKIKNKIWRARLITSENHLSQKRTRIEFTKIEINSEGKAVPRIGKQTVEPSL